MCVQNAFGNRTGLEQGETEQNRVADNTPDGRDGVVCDGHRLNENGIDAHTDQDEEALKTQGKEAAQIVLAHLTLLMAAEGGERNWGQTDRHINLDHTSINDDKNHDGQDAQGDADEEGLQKQSKQRPHIHLHQAGFQVRQSGLIDCRVSCDDAAGFSDDSLRQIKNTHDNIKGVGDQVDGAAGLDDPFGNQGRLKAGQVVVLGDHLHQLIAGHQGQENTCNGKNCRIGYPADHLKYTGFKVRRTCAHLRGNLSHLLVHRIEQAGEVGHDCAGQNTFDPVRNRVEYGFQRVSPPLSEEMVDEALEQVENKNDVGENFHRDLPFYHKVQRIAASNRPEHPVIFAACRGGADAGIGKIAVCIFHI